MDRPMLPRSISSADLERTKSCINYVERDLNEYPLPPGTVNYFASITKFTLTLPSLRDYPKEFQDYVFRRLVDQRVKEELESARVINWCKDASSLTPLSTAGDGNCLLHASSLGMWGFQDRRFILRRAIHTALKHEDGTILYPRWKLWREEELSTMDVQLDQGQWKREWELMIDTVSMDRKGGSLQGLEQFHIFVLANVLRRPIIVYSLSKLRSAVEGTTLQRINFQGLYLPLLWDPKQCIRSPLPIAFSSGHYVSLVVKDSPHTYKNGRIVLPIVQNDNQDFPVMFKIFHENDCDCRRAYLDITYAPNSEYRRGVACAELHVDEQPTYLKPLLSGFIGKCFDAFQFEDSQARVNNIQQQVFVPSGGSGAGVVPDGRVKCKNGCDFYGDPQLNGYCSQCSKKQKVTPPASSSSALCCCNCQLKPGHPIHLGMCEECYYSKKASGSGSGSGTLERKLSAESSSVRSAPVTDEARPCHTPGCEYTGTKDKMYYCSTCYKRKFPTGHMTNDTRRDRSGSSGTSGGTNRPVPSVIRDELVLNTGGRISSTEVGVPHGGMRGVVTTGPHPLSDSAPNKCPVCCEYYGSEEYGGLCNGCFMKKTKEQVVTESKPQPTALELVCGECGRLPGCEVFEGLCNECFFKTEDRQKKFSSEQIRRESIDSPSPLSNGREYGLQRGQSREQPVPGGRDYELQRVQSREQPVPGGRDYVLQRGQSREQLLPTGGVQLREQRRIDSPLSPDDRDVEPTPKPHPLYPERRKKRNSTGGQSCFLCDPDQLITISNVVCQQHALKMREIWLSMSSRTTPMERYSGNGAIGIIGGTPVTGATNGAVGGVTTAENGSSHDHESSKPIKVLCRTVGCSYIQIPELHGYCRDCYKSKPSRITDSN